MKLHNYLDHSLISLYNNEVTSKEDLIKAMVKRIEKHPTIEKSKLSADMIFDALMKRESLASTGLGNGVAMPHARLPEIDEIVVSFFTLEREIDYGALDNLPVSVAALILIPEKKPGKGLKIMAQFAHLFAKHLEKVKTIRSVKELIRLVAELDLSIEEPLLAKDIMSELPFEVFEETPLKDITKQMETFHLNGVPVLNSAHELVGEITCGNLFNIGIPEFFKSLKSVSFVSYYDPFEGYFEQEAKAVASTVMTPVATPLELSTTILEIVYLLVVKKYPMLYVVDAGKVVGMINPNTVLNRIINL